MNADLTDRIRAAIAEPHLYTPRAENGTELLTYWQARAAAMAIRGRAWDHTEALEQERNRLSGEVFRLTAELVQVETERNTLRAQLTDSTKEVA